MPTSKTGSRQRLRACSPAASQLLQSEKLRGHSQRHLDFAILGSSIVRLTLQPQHDGRAFLIGYQLRPFSPKVQTWYALSKKVWSVNTESARIGFGNPKDAPAVYAAQARA
jgi:hypothetical protein